MPLTMGQAPEALKVVLVAGADFVTQLRRKDNSPWPSAAQLQLAFDREGGVTEWPASFAGSTAIWDIDVADVNALIAQRPRFVRLWYVDGGLRLIWAQGELDIRRN